MNAREAAREYRLSYLTVLKHYERFRKHLLVLLEEDYERHRDRVREYDEYLYLDHCKRRDKRYIFDAHNFLTFDYGGKVYTILMPSPHRYKTPFLDDGLEEVYYREFKRFLSIHRVARLRSRDNTILRFWRTLDESFKRYKGIPADHFIYYLKEIEFKFNYPMPEREEVLRKLLLKGG